ncbi:cell division protein FtsL [Sneathiella limimaris]|uniref:cell division protein FtsL n=1 Tax=Sneathiella limimaris TaxID=1964213 RepID=UPI00146A77E7|nr:hypothetical protein [Sneathiella limimaris]
MKWKVYALIALAFVTVSSGLYKLSYEVQQLNGDLRNIRAQIKDNRQAIQVLKAEWAYRNRPDNLQALTAKYLPLLLVAPYQVASLEDLPERELSPEITSILGVPIPRRKPRLEIIEEVPLPPQGLHLATYQVQDRDLD